MLLPGLNDAELADYKMDICPLAKVGLRSTNQQMHTRDHIEDNVGDAADLGPGDHPLVR
jgi:hypothetical protein